MITPFIAVAAQYGWTMTESKLTSRNGNTHYKVEVKGKRVRLVHETPERCLHGTLAASFPITKPEAIGQWLEAMFYAKKI